MKTRLVSLAVVVAALASFAVAASAATTIDHHSTGKLTKFTYNKQTQAGHLTVTHKGKRIHYRVTKETVCGERRGESGDPIACKDLGEKKYHGHSTQITWHKGSNGGRVASLVSVEE